MRECVDCGERIGIRATRCKSCRRIHRTRYERDRVAAQRDSRAADAPETYAPESTVVGRDMIARDYTIPGSASKPPSFDVHPKQPKPTRPDVITDGRVPSPVERQHRPSLDGIPNAIRRDRVRLEAALARQNSGADYDASEMTSWDELQARNARKDDGRTVLFDKSAFSPPGPRPLRQVNAIGQSIPRARRWS
jgi:hypothetical protein